MKYKYDGPKRTHARTDSDYQQYTVKIESKFNGYKRQDYKDIGYEYDEPLRIYERTHENLDTDQQQLTTTITYDDKNIDPYDEYQTNTIPAVDDKWIQTTSTNEIEYELLQTIWMTGH
ncbi:hypothetical protein CLU79DRAFT_846611 [Phycomyces nitens]|nr:hypothetical protein CLU79DRAFT_846611 [Phycomyces nitens]